MIPRMNKIEKQITLDENHEGMRLDAALAKSITDFSRGQIQNWIKQGSVVINGVAITQKRHKVHDGDSITISAEPQAEGSWQAEEIPLNIIYEDNHLLIINKPPGLVVHPGAGNHAGTMLNALLHHAPQLEEVTRAGIVHRLDKLTSGLLIIAKTASCHHLLTQMMQERVIKRHYEALVHGTFIAGGTIQEPIGRHATNRKKMAVTMQGRPATTHYRIIQNFTYHAHLAISLETGRTHQIRVHMAHSSHPVIGDPEYCRHRVPSRKHGEKLQQALQEFPRQALHAKSLSFIHPITEQEMNFTAPLPEDMENLRKLLAHDKPEH